MNIEEKISRVVGGCVTIPHLHGALRFVRYAEKADLISIYKSNFWHDRIIWISMKLIDPDLRQRLYGLMKKRRLNATRNN